MRCICFFRRCLKKAKLLLKKSEALSVVDTSFAPRDSPRHKRNEIGRHVTQFHWSWRSVLLIPNIHSLNRYLLRAAFVAEGIRMFLLEPAYIYLQTG